MDKELFEKAVRLAPNERVIFAELLLASIEHEESEIQSAWISEVKERMKAVKEGRAKLFNFDELYSAG